MSHESHGQDSNETVDTDVNFNEGPVIDIV